MEAALKLSGGALRLKAQLQTNAFGLVKMHAMSRLEFFYFLGSRIQTFLVIDLAKTLASRLFTRWSPVARAFATQ